MYATLPIEVYEAFEKIIGKEDARKVIKSIETTINDVTEIKWKTTKAELLEDMEKKFATKDDLKDDLSLLKTELEGKIESLNQKFNFMIILMIIALTLMNPVAAEIIRGLIK
ncbi:MAG: hypothetical protein HY279_14065 [Nitrospinae bacterium]|nr:hypothetical protein [Nitrospinota bacterium]